MNTTVATTTVAAATTATKVIKVSRNAMQSAADIVAPLSGAPAKVERFAAALVPLLSTYITDGGNSVELTAPDMLTLKQSHSTAAKQLWACKGRGKGAFALLVSTARGHGARAFSGDQSAHDDAIQAFEQSLAAVFVTVVKAKDPTKETPTQKISRLEAEVVGLKIERDALQAALNAVKTPATATA